MMIVTMILKIVLYSHDVMTDGVQRLECLGAATATTVEVYIRY